MAIVTLRDVQVVRVNRSGYGVQVKEQDRESGGKTFKGDRFTVWFKEPHGLTEGDTVSLSGFLSAKVSEWQDRDENTRHSVELSLNSPKVEGWPRKSEPADTWSDQFAAEDSPF